MGQEKQTLGDLFDSMENSVDYLFKVFDATATSIKADINTAKAEIEKKRIIDEGIRQLQIEEITSRRDKS